MATPLTADRLLAVLRAEGVRVVEYRAWRTHERDDETGRTFGPVHGLVIHHTAGRNSLTLCYDGHSTLPGPLCHTHLAKDGTTSMISAGRANHCGGMARNAYDAMVAESSTHPRPDSAEPVDGNDCTYGLEIENLGDGSDPYPAVQYDQAVRWAAAICRAHGWSDHSVIGHKEATRRKIDPSFSMDAFRAAVAERLTHPASWNPNDPEDDMPSAEEIAREVWAYSYDHGGKTITARTRLGRAYENSLGAKQAAQQAVALLGAQTAVLDAIRQAVADGGGLTAEQAEAAATAGALAALAELADALTD
ncbi:N-acetylmuramoyl-L-alanine amidase [Streptomyces sp. 4N509B]|uniref:N-acetylmuramoyl-L-alanine amidase n=1 Tax=Streptomyces sp. 4N509B TaxID=3457413 RepID=UPI003FD1CD79